MRVASYFGFVCFLLAPSTSYEVNLQTFGDSWESELTSRFIRTFSASNEDNLSSSSVLPPISGLQVVPLR